MADEEALQANEAEFRRCLGQCVRDGKRRLKLPDDSIRTVLLMEPVEVDLRIRLKVPLEGKGDSGREWPEEGQHEGLS